MAGLGDILSGSGPKDGGAASLAVVTGEEGTLEVRWLPRALSAEPRFLAYSITKTFTAVLMLMLQERGRLQLDQPLSLWFSKVPRAAHISLRQLLNHTSGMPDYGGLQAYHESLRTDPTRPWTFERFAAETFEKGLLFEPGADWAYSNPAYMLLKSVAESASGRSYAELVRDWIAEPQGLDETFVAETLDDMSVLTSAPSQHLSSDGHPRDARTHYHPGWVSHGVVASRASDIARFYHALFAGRLIALASLREMTDSVSLSDDPPNDWEGTENYGLGVMGDPIAFWGHGGGGPGYQAFAACTPKPGPDALSVCAMCASEDDRVAEALALAAWKEYRSARSPGP